MYVYNLTFRQTDRQAEVYISFPQVNNIEQHESDARRKLLIGGERGHATEVLVHPTLPGGRKGEGGREDRRRKGEGGREKEGRGWECGREMRQEWEVYLHMYMYMYMYMYEHVYMYMYI